MRSREKATQRHMHEGICAQQPPPLIFITADEALFSLYIVGRLSSFHVTIYKRSLTCSAHFLRRRPINSDPLAREPVWWRHLLRAQTLRLSADDFGLGRSSIIKSLLTKRAPAQISFWYRMEKVEKVERAITHIAWMLICIVVAIVFLKNIFNSYESSICNIMKKTVSCFKFLSHIEFYYMHLFL